MDNLFEIGQKIKYKLLDKKGKEHWFDGLIHGIKRSEDPSTNLITNITYLVDTGRSTRIDEHTFNPRAREIDKRIKKISLVKRGHGMEHEETLEEINKIFDHDDLPDNTIETELIRQPEQLELSQNFIKAK